MGRVRVSGEFAIDSSELTAAAAELDPSAVADVEGEAIDPALRDLGRIVQANIRAAARRHRRTGRLDAGIRVEATGSALRTLVEVSAGPPANLIVGGTRPHDIRPLASRALPIGGREPFVAIVHHPGTAPDPFVAEGIRRSDDDVARELDHAGEVIVTRLADDLGG